MPPPLRPLLLLAAPSEPAVVAGTDLGRKREAGLETGAPLPVPIAITKPSSASRSARGEGREAVEAASRCGPGWRILRYLFCLPLMDFNFYSNGLNWFLVGRDAASRWSS